MMLAGARRRGGDPVREVERLGRELMATLSGDPWYGSAVSNILDGIDAAMASAHPIQGAHSIWELVVHMTAWVNETKRRLEGGSHRPPAEGDWPAVRSTTREAWTDALAALRRAHEDLARTLEAAEDSSLSRQIGGAQVDAMGHPVTFYQTIIGILQHDTYHAGQIALLKKALSNR
jgi:uncharacterized damage-inducible protein DinB